LAFWQSPEAPQKPLSVLGLTQVPLQLTSPCWQLKRHAPSEQIWPAGHAEPEFAFWQSPVAPQKELSDRGLMHVPLQLMSPCWQVRPHFPLEHTCPAAHAVPQVPQFALSVSVLAQ